VSTFSALAILERRHSGQWAAYYNGGNLPLATMLPGRYTACWVLCAVRVHQHQLPVAG
jgi:hypothetical protein